MQETLYDSVQETLYDSDRGNNQTIITNHNNKPYILPNASHPSTSAKSKGATKKPNTPAPTTPVWNAYVSAYLSRYGVEPIRAAKVNSQLSTLIKTVGQDKAIKLASYYLTHNKPIYANNRHSVDLLLKDCAALHTDMMTGNQSFATTAPQRPQPRGNFANSFDLKNTEWLDEVMEEYRQEREGN